MARGLNGQPCMSSKPDEQPVNLRAVYLLAFGIGLAVAGCTAQNPASTVVARQFDESKGTLVDLSSAIPGQWERVCILGPYSENTAAKKALGFEWNVEANSTISRNDGISLLIFVQDNKVVSFIEHSRRHGDFSNLTTRCFTRQAARFHQVAKPIKGWPGLFPIADHPS